MRAFDVGRALQALAMALLLFGLGVGIFERSMSGELSYLFVAIPVFYFGWLLTRRRS